MFGFNEKELRKKLVKAGVPQERHNEAIASLKKGYDQYQLKKPMFWKAPIVMFWLLYLTKKVKWEDDALPAKFWKYDNNISMNGDQWGMILEDGTHVSTYDRELVNSGKVTAIEYKDPNFKANDCYYCRGHHPRSRRARYAWMGLRNKGSLYAMMLGELVDPLVDHESFGEEPSGKKETLQVLTNNGVWQIRENKRLFGLIGWSRNLGYKVNNTSVTHPRASVTWGIRR